ncbi:hypothetical protein L6R29_16915 [Myxococcota bacterium]|nr:hypothetical protein [Myxococcota bacterium]
MFQRFVSLSALCLGLFASLSPTHANEPYTKEELNLSKPPPARIQDKRLQRVYQTLAKQYKHVYGYAAQDGYLMPREIQELGFHRRLIRRIIDIDENYAQLRKELQSLHQKARTLRRRRKTLDQADQKRQTELLAKQEHIEQMIRRFACRHDAQYKQRNPKHCPKITL